MHARWAGRWPELLPGGAPVLPVLPVPAPGAGSEFELGQLRSFVALAFADELVADPSLLTAFAEHFGPDDDVTLAIYAPDGNPATVEQELGQAISAAGIDDALCPDLLAIATPGSSETELQLTRCADAVFSNREGTSAFSGLPWFGASELDDLRSAAHPSVGTPELVSR
jgi:hypothetical protein